MRAGVRMIERELGVAQVTARYEARVTINNRRACDRSTQRSTVGGYPVTICTLMRLGVGRSGVACLGRDNQPEGVRSVDAKNHSRWLPGNYLHLDATRSGTVGRYWS
jgi:hypothetical protein